MFHRSALNSEETLQPEPATSVAPTQSVRSFALFGLCIGYSMIILDANVLNVTLPAIIHHLHAGPESFLWFVNIYPLIFAALLLTSGALGDRLGVRPVFLAGLFLFTAATLASSLAPNIDVLIAARGLQGVGAAFIAPGSLALITHAYPDAHQRARAIAIYSAIGGIGFVVGPLLGGLLINVAGWRSTFLVNVPLGLLAIALTIRYVPIAPRSFERGFDPAGQFLAILFLVPLTFAIIKSEQLGWTAQPVLAGAGLSLVAIVVFLLVESRNQKAMFPLQLFTVPTFAVANVLAYFYNFGLYGLLLVLTLFLQNIQKISALQTAVLFLPLTLAYLLTSWLLSGRLVARRGVRFPLLVGTVGACLGAALIALTEGSNVVALLIGLLIFGSGLGVIFPAMLAAILSSAKLADAGIGSAILNTCRQVGGVLGPALAGTLVSANAFQGGMRITLLLVASGFFLCFLLILFFIPRLRPGS